MAATGGEAGTGHKLGWCGAHILARALQRHGVEVMFGQSLPSALHLVAPEFGIRQIAYRTENAGASMADGYARVSHKVARGDRRRTARRRRFSSPGSPKR